VKKSIKAKIDVIKTNEKLNNNFTLNLKDRSNKNFETTNSVKFETNY